MKALVGENTLLDYVFPALLLVNIRPFKVVGKAQGTKSNLHNFRYRCLVVTLIDVSEVLAQTLRACMNYERKKSLKIV